MWGFIKGSRMARLVGVSDRRFRFFFLLLLVLQFYSILFYSILFYSTTRTRGGKKTPWVARHSVLTVRRSTPQTSKCPASGLEYVT